MEISLFTLVLFISGSFSEISELAQTTQSNSLIRRRSIGNAAPTPAIVKVNRIDQKSIAATLSGVGTNETKLDLFLIEPKFNHYNNSEAENNQDQHDDNNHTITDDLNVYASTDGVSHAIFSDGALVKAILPSASEKTIYNLKLVDVLRPNVYLMDARLKGSMKNLNRARQKRSNKKMAINIDILAIVDSSVLEFFTKLDSDMHSGFNQRRVLTAIKEWYAHLISSASKMYDLSLKDDPDISIHLNLIKVIVMRNEQDAPWSDTNNLGVQLSDSELPVGADGREGRSAIDATRVLEEFRKSMLKLKVNIPYDHAIGFTRKLLSLKREPLRKGTRSTLSSFLQEGVAYHSLKGYGLLRGKILLGICRGYGFSVISDRMSVRSQFVIAHEIGHNLGLSHDGDQKQVYPDCESQTNHLMTPVLNMLPTNRIDFRRNAFRLSSCSVQELKSMLFTNNRTAIADAFCLLNKASGSKLESNELPGEIYSAHFQCKMWAGIQGSFCINMTEDICTAMSCRRKPQDDHCIFLSSGAMDGTPCDKTRWCFQGRCVPHRRAPEQCLWGDAVHDCYRLRGWSNKTHNPTMLCKEPHMKSMCCETCRDFSDRKDANSGRKKEEKIDLPTMKYDNQFSDKGNCPKKFTRMANMCLAAFRKPRNHTSANRFCKRSSPSSRLLYFDTYKEFEEAEAYFKLLRTSATESLIWLSKRSPINFRNLGGVEQMPEMCPGISIKRLSIEKVSCSEENMIVCRFS